MSNLGARAHDHAVIERFDVPPNEERAFLAAWAAEAPAGMTLYRALRPETRPRFLALADAPQGGVLLIVPDPADLRGFESRRGYLGARVVRDAEGRSVGVAHWSSPLMYARAAGAAARGALYARASVGRDA
jgi:hypothetical protein